MSISRLFANLALLSTVNVLSIRTDRFAETVQTQIRLLLLEQSDQGLHCLSLHLQLLDVLLHCNFIVSILQYVVVSLWLFLETV